MNPIHKPCAWLRSVLQAASERIARRHERLGAALFVIPALLLPLLVTGVIQALLAMLD